MKIIKPFMTETLLDFKNEAREARARHEKPWNPDRFYLTMASGNYKLQRQEINDLVDTYQFFSLYEDDERAALIVSCIAGACAISEVDETNRDALSYFLSGSVEAICGLNKVQDPVMLNQMTKSVHQLVVKHLPHLNLDAMGVYLANSRKLTHWAKPEFNEMSFHPVTEVLDHRAMSEFFMVKTNQALSSIIEHFFDSDLRTYGDAEFDFNRSDERRYGDGIAKLTALSSVITQLADAKHYLPIKYPDLILLAGLVDRFAIAAGSSPSEKEREFFSNAATSLISLTTNFPKGKVSKDHNLFLRDGTGFEWLPADACKLLEPSYLNTLPATGIFTQSADQSLLDMNWKILKNAIRVHAKHQATGYDNSGLVRGLASLCADVILDQKNLSPLPKDQVALLTSCVDDSETQRLLLARNKDIRGQVLMDSMGI